MNRTVFRRICVLGVLSFAWAGASVPARADLRVAQDGSKAHKLLLINDAQGEFIVLGPGEGIFSDLFASHDPGWASADANQPPDFFTLLPGHQVSLERLSFDPGFAMYYPFTGTQILEADGAIYTFDAQPNGAFDNDLIYAADGPAGTTYSATYQLVDPSGVHSPSDPFTLKFQAVPEPASVLLLTVACSIGLRLRRSMRQSIQWERRLRNTA